MTVALALPSHQKAGGNVTETSASIMSERHPRQWRSCGTSAGIDDTITDTGCAVGAASARRVGSVENIAVAVISVLGALVGTWVGGWVSLKAAARQHELQRRDQELRLLDDAFFRCIDALESYRRLELNRAHEAVRDGISTDTTTSAPLVRDSRSACRRAILVFKIHCTEAERTKTVDDLFNRIQLLGDQPSIAAARELSAILKDDLEQAVVTFSESRQASLG